MRRLNNILRCSRKTAFIISGQNLNVEFHSGIVNRLFTVAFWRGRTWRESSNCSESLHFVENAAATMLPLLLVEYLVKDSFAGILRFRIQKTRSKSPNLNARLDEWRRIRITALNSRSETIGICLRDLGLGTTIGRAWNTFAIFNFHRVFKFLANLACFMWVQDTINNDFAVIMTSIEAFPHPWIHCGIFCKSTLATFHFLPRSYWFACQQCSMQWWCQMPLQGLLYSSTLV